LSFRTCSYSPGLLAGAACWSCLLELLAGDACWGCLLGCLLGLLAGAACCCCLLLLPAAVAVCGWSVCSRTGPLDLMMIRLLSYIHPLPFPQCLTVVSGLVAWDMPVVDLKAFLSFSTVGD